MSKNLVEVTSLKKYFEVSSSSMNPFLKDRVHAVDDVTFGVEEGTTLAVVGESGCGKTTLGRCILRLIEPTSGSIFFKGQDITRCKSSEMKLLRRDMQIIFQDPFSSLDPRMRVGDIIAEPLNAFSVESRSNKDERVAKLMESVGIPYDNRDRFPHDFSGGQRQRIAIARAIALNPKFIVGDEPVSALDVSVRAQILNLMKGLKETLNLTYLYISHDLSTVRFISDMVAVMYLGKIVELATTEDIFENRKHPYTDALISCVPIPDPSVRTANVILKGEPPSAIKPPKGCRFEPRCAFTKELCKQEEPATVEVGKAHYVACHLLG